MVFFIKAASYLPFWFLYLISDLLAFGMQHFYRKEVVLSNLTNAFPDKSPSEIQSITKAFYKNLADIIVETIKGLSISEKVLKKRVHFKNMELINDYHESQQSVLVIAAHQCNWEWLLLGGCLQMPFPIDGIYAPLKNPTMDKLMLEMRSRFGGKPINKRNALIEIMKRSKVLKALAIVADQVPGKNTEKYWTSFLNQDTAFFTGAEQLARWLKYPVIFLHVERRKRGHYEVTFRKLAEPPYDASNMNVLPGYVKEAENMIKARPHEWLWSHKRWKYKKSVYD